MTDKPLKRPRDPAQLAKLMIDIASGKVTEGQPTAKQTRARKTGTKGGPARGILFSQTAEPTTLAGGFHCLADQSQSFLTGRSDSIHTRPFHHTYLNWCAIPN
jgi:hypothetical protein